jgi:hypothetical protein
MSAASLVVLSRNQTRSLSLTSITRAARMRSPSLATVPTMWPTAITELGSENVSGTVRAARSIPGSTAAQQSDRFLKDRSAGAGRRIRDAITNATGHNTPTDTDLPIEQHIQNARTQAGPLYKQADAYGQIQDPETVAEIQRLLKEPIFQRGWRPRRNARMHRR